MIVHISLRSRYSQGQQASARLVELLSQGRKMISQRFVVRIVTLEVADRVRSRKFYDGVLG